MSKHLISLAMTAFIGTKEVLAAPMSRGEYNQYQGWTIPEGENPSDDGYLIEYLNGGKPNHPEHTGYISWSPKDVFEQAYKPPKLNSNLTFGEALELLKSGVRVARSGWNGKDMWLKLLHPTEYVLMTLPYIYMKTATNDLVPWLASQTDMLAEDWLVLDEAQTLSTNDKKKIGQAIASTINPEFLGEAKTNIEDSLKCKNCGKAKDDSSRIAHNHLMEKCHLLRDIVSISVNDHRSADPNKELKESAAAKLKTLIEGF